MSDLLRVLEQKRLWSQATFGSIEERGPLGPLRHLLKELDEVEQDPDDIMEFVDLMFLIDDACMRAGVVDPTLYQRLLKSTDEPSDYRICVTFVDLMERMYALHGFVDALETDIRSIRSLTGLIITRLENPDVFPHPLEFLAVLWMHIWTLARQEGHSPEALARAAAEKFEILKTRTYPKTADGVPSEHIKESV